MLKKENRLIKNSEFSRVFQKGSFIRKNFFLLKYTTDKSLCTQFGFVVSGKVSKSAVVRNTIKRRMREIIRKHKEKFHIYNTFIFILRKSSAGVSFSELEREVLSALKKMYNKI